MEAVSRRSEAAVAGLRRRGVAKNSGGEHTSATAHSGVSAKWDGSVGTRASW